jgi:flagellar assembly protein FliH
MSEANVIPTVSVLAAEDAAAVFQRWQMPTLDAWADPEAAAHTARHLDQLEAAAYEEGFARGRNEGYAAGAAAAREQAQRLHNLLDHLRAPLAEFDAEIERMLIALTIEVGRRLVGAQLQLDPALTANAVREALDALGTPPREARIHLNGEDLNLLKDVVVPPDGASQWRFVADPKLRSGDCRIVTEGAQVDAQLDTRQASLSRALLGDNQ